MAKVTIKLPDVGEGIAEAELTEWAVKVGDEIQEDDVLGTVMTDKAAVEVPSSVSGKVVWLAGEPGDTLAIGSKFVALLGGHTHCPTVLHQNLLHRAILKDLHSVGFRRPGDSLTQAACSASSESPSSGNTVEFSEVVMKKNVSRPWGANTKKGADDSASGLDSLERFCFEPLIEKIRSTHGHEATQSMEISFL